MRSQLSTLFRSALLCLLVVALAAPAAAQDRPTAGPGGIAFNPSIDYERAVLTIAGMGTAWTQSVDGNGPDHNV